MDVAGRMTQSDAKNLFASKSFENWKKTQDHTAKLLMAIISRQDAQISALNNLIKAR